jgi:enoyl-[acyl-carrier protein] reductase II
MHSPLHTPLCDRLGIQYPIFLAGMGGVSLAPLVAAVSNAGGRGLVAALALGAEGAIFGTRFIASPESQAAPGYREALVRSNEADTMRTRAYTGKPARAIRTPYAEEWETRPGEIQPFPFQAMTSIQNRAMDYPGLTENFDDQKTFMPAGQGVGMIHEIKPAEEIVRDIVSEAEAVIDKRFVQPSLQAEQR